MADEIIVETTSTEVIEVGVPGPQGPSGTAGTADNGLPNGGTTGQLLRKASSTDYDAAWTSAVTALEASSSNPTNVDAALGLQVAAPSAGGSSAVGLAGVFSGGTLQARLYGAGTDGSLTNIALFDINGVTVATGTLKLKDATGGETATFDPSGLSANRTYTLTNATGRLPAVQALTASDTPYPYSPGVPGQFIFASSGYLYVCLETNRWRRVQLSEGATTSVISVTGNASTDTFTATNHGFTSGQRIRFTMLNGGTASVGGLSVNTLYYVRNQSTNTFQIAEIGGVGAPIFNLTATISSPSFFTKNDWL